MTRLLECPFKGGDICTEERCGLYVNHLNCCAILSIAIGIRNMKDGK